MTEPLAVDPWRWLEEGFSLHHVRVTPISNSLWLDDQERAIEPRVMRVLVLLARHAGTPVGRDTLLAEMSDARYPSDETLTQAISKLRQALGDDPKKPVFIKTVPKRGYMLLAPVTRGAPLASGGGQTSYESPDKVIPNLKQDPLVGLFKGRLWSFLLLLLIAVLLVYLLTKDSETQFIEQEEIEFFEKD